MPTAEQPTTLRPPLKWAGGKRWQVPHLQPLWDAHTRRRLVEPFCGGLAVTLGLIPARTLLNDANPHLINFYRWLQKGLRVDLAMENDEAVFYQHRDRFNALLTAGKGTSREAAALFYYLNPHRLQRPVPVQREGRLQRALRPLRPDRLRARLHAVS